MLSSLCGHCLPSCQAECQAPGLLVLFVTSDRGRFSLVYLMTDDTMYDYCFCCHYTISGLISNITNNVGFEKNC